MSATRDPELASFKTEIDLRVYAASVEGYELDPKESWRGSAVMRHSNGDKIVIKRDTDQNYVYFSVRDPSDNGSIIDFVQRRLPSGRRNLGNVRLALRPFLSSGGRRASNSNPALPLFGPLTVTTKDRLEVEKQFRFMDWVERHPYLEGERCIPYDVLAAVRFSGFIKVDRRGNAVFPHFDELGLCGYEIKNAGYTGFSKGGEKGLWLSRSEDDDHRLVICESAIDALSHATLFPSGATRYVSLGGQMNKKQPALLTAMMSKLPANAEVIAATDNDDDGLRYADTLVQLLDNCARDDLQFSVHRPHDHKDWNQVLQKRENSSPPYCPT
jgi:hypothetical protein